ncbi:MAG: iron-sulfur cluster assembly protein [Alphaproteobacteria bacterium]|nr:iron-sulfur cluster assembly protein [Alphaproteobacteria bacterium]
MKEQIIEKLKQVYDPEISVNVYDLGLIREIIIPNPETRTPDPVIIKMTFTSPTCPFADELMQMVQMNVEQVVGKGNMRIEIVWDPPWSLKDMSAAARIELDLTDEGW